MRSSTASPSPWSTELASLACPGRRGLGWYGMAVEREETGGASSLDPRTLQAIVDDTGM